MHFTFCIFLSVKISPLLFFNKLPYLSSLSFILTVQIPLKEFCKEKKESIPKRFQFLWNVKERQTLSLLSLNSAPLHRILTPGNLSDSSDSIDRVRTWRRTAELRCQCQSRQSVLRWWLKHSYVLMGRSLFPSRWEKWEKLCRRVRDRNKQTERDRNLNEKEAVKYEQSITQSCAKLASFPIPFPIHNGAAGLCAGLSGNEG